jgi:uncharacterized protein YegL
MISPLVATDTLAAAARRHPVALVVDCSFSVSPFEQQVRELFRQLPSAMRSRPSLVASVELALITMSHEGVRLRTGDPEVAPYGFQRLADLRLPLDAVCDGVSMLGDALSLAARIIQARCDQIAGLQRSYVCPYLGVLSDGEPTDARGAREDVAWRSGAKQVRGLLGERVQLQAFAPEGTDGGILPELIAGRGGIHPYDPAKVVELIEAISFSVEHTQRRRRPISVIAEDIARGERSTR